MAAIISHPQNALQAKAFTAPSSLSYGTGDITPPSSDVEGQKSHQQQQQQQQQQSGDAQGPDADNAPATPAATPGGGPGVSGIVPTLQ
jgi:transcription initiation factor TFIID TATA-box-binding protein